MSLANIVRKNKAFENWIATQGGNQIKSQLSKTYETSWWVLSILIREISPVDFKEFLKEFHAISILNINFQSPMDALNFKINILLTS